MNRRAAIRNILVASAGTIFITNCAESDVVEFLVDGRLQLNERHREYLAKISETILPVSGISDKIGAPVDFILTMLNDCHPPEEVVKFAQGFDQYKLLMKESRLRLRSADPADAIPVIKSALDAMEPKDELVFFINTTRDLSVRNLLSSEYYMTEYMEYRLVPEQYQACS